MKVKLNILLVFVFCFLSFPDAVLGQTLSGVWNPIAYKPYKYRVQYPTGIEVMSFPYTDHYIQIVNGKIMDENGNFSLVEKELNEQNDYSCYIIWDCEEFGYINMYNASSGGRVDSLVFCPVCTRDIEGITYTSNVQDTIVGAYLNIQNVTIPAGVSVNFNGIKEVVISAPFHAKEGSIVSIKSHTPALPTTIEYEENYTATRESSYENLASLNIRIEQTLIADVYIPNNTTSALLFVQSIDRNYSKQIVLSGVGACQLDISRLNLPRGNYVCSLVVNDKLIVGRKFSIK